VTNLENGRRIKLKVNDRGPFAKGRIIDVSRRGAQLLGFDGNGTARVRVEIVADESRAIAASMLGKTDPVIAEKTPAAPPAAVASADLPPPPGVKAAPPSRASAPPPAPPPPVVSAMAAPVTVDPDLKQVAVKPTRMFIQAGAFAEYVNANRMKIRLQSLGPTQVSQVDLGNRPLFRVRIGPIQNVDEADRLLDRVMKAGYPEARLIVD
jgi:rare lipoprotein A